MPHIGDKRYAAISCHVERPLHDEAWRRFADFQRRAPGGFRIAALMRPPDVAAGEDEAMWIERATAAQARGPLGHHTHWGGPATARPATGDGTAERVRAEASWLRERGFEPRLFCGGGWYSDAEVAAALAELGYADCTATAFRPSYLAAEAPRLTLEEPAWLRVGELRLLELPTTHSLGMIVRAALSGPGVRVLHGYFHDTDLLDTRRRLALTGALVALGRRRTVTDLERLAADEGATAPDVTFDVAARRGNRHERP